MKILKGQPVGDRWIKMRDVSATVEECNGILATLGQLPTSSGAWPLVVKIKQQAEAQLPPEPKSEN